MNLKFTRMIRKPGNCVNLTMNFEDMQKEANLVSWGAEYLDQVDHDW